MPADSTATSVPAPIAMPDVGRGEGRRVVDAVADEGDLAAALLEPLDGGRLVGRQDLGRDLVDAEPAGDGVGDGLAVAGDHRHANAELVERRDGFRRLRSDLVLDRKRSCHGPRHDDVEDRLTGALPVVRFEGRVDAEVGEEARTAHNNVSALHRGPRAAPWERLEPRRHRRLDPATPGGFDDRTSQRVLRVGLDRRGDAKHVGLRRSVGPNAGDDGAALRERAGLVEDHDLDLARPFEREAVLDEQAVASAERGRDRDDQRDREAEGVRAGDDQHGRRADERALAVARGATTWRA